MKQELHKSRKPEALRRELWELARNDVAGSVALALKFAKELGSLPSDVAEMLIMGFDDPEAYLTALDNALGGSWQTDSGSAREAWA